MWPSCGECICGFLPFKKKKVCYKKNMNAPNFHECRKCTTNKSLMQQQQKWCIIDQSEMSKLLCM